MKTIIGMSALGLMAAMLSGCFQAHGEATVPSGWGIPSEAPSATIAPANPKSVEDLSRENQQLRQRIAYLERDNGSLQKKQNDKERKIADIRAENDKIAAEAARYKQAAGQ